MSINAVHAYLQGLVNGQPSPQLPNAVAYILPPPIPTEAGSAPNIYVWAAQANEERYTMPRGGGQKKVTYQVPLTVRYATDPNAADLTTAFPALLDAIIHTLRTTPLPAPLTDSLTGQQSTVLYVGEVIHSRLSVPQLANNMLWLNAELTCDLVELVQG